MIRIASATVLLMILSIRLVGVESTRRFTFIDDIGLTTIDAVMFSPNHRYFAVTSVVGRLDLNCPESTLRIYQMQEVRRFMADERIKTSPAPFWIINECAYREGPNLSSVRWLADSSGLVFLAKNRSGNDQLVLADLKTRKPQPLTPAHGHVTAFDFRSRNRFVYALLSPAIAKRTFRDNSFPSFAGTGRTLDSLVFPEQSKLLDIWTHDLSELWVVRDGKKFRVNDAASGRPLAIHLEGQRGLALSPDGRQVITALSVSTIPKEWEQMYPSPVPASPYRIVAHKQNPDGFSGQRDISEYVVVDLLSGKTHPIVDAPIGNGLGWWGFSHSEWSADGKLVVLSDTFLPPIEERPAHEENGPCVAVSDLDTGHSECLMQWANPKSFGDVHKGLLVHAVHFDPVRKNTISVLYANADGSEVSRNFVQKDGGSWTGEVSAPYSHTGDHAIEIAVKESINDPPVLCATDARTKTSRIIWDPNRRMRAMELGKVSVFTWSDETGREWIGGLYKPPDYVDGRRYPLIIQTHGFDEHRFAPSGSFTTAFAAQELAAVGFLVLQVRDCPIRSTPEEAACQLGGYKAAVDRLSSAGLVDPAHVGIIGFSRTCYYVLSSLTSQLFHFQAAAITDGVDEGYLQYILDLDLNTNNSIAREAETIIGAAPFGEGLQKWLQRSPLFNMDRVTAPLQVVTTRQTVFQMWEPYATLRYLNKPVDLILLNSTEHVLTNPAVRLASQGSTVDWFRFWLQGYKDPDPRKSEQYERWELLRSLSSTNGPPTNREATKIGLQNQASETIDRKGASLNAAASGVRTPPPVVIRRLHTPALTACCSSPGCFGPLRCFRSGSL